jgi:hypothetical protein
MGSGSRSAAAIQIQAAARTFLAQSLIKEMGLYRVTENSTGDPDSNLGVSVEGGGSVVATMAEEIIALKLELTIANKHNAEHLAKIQSLQSEITILWETMHVLVSESTKDVLDLEREVSAARIRASSGSGSDRLLPTV